MRVWITGAAGFVGAKLCARLRGEGHTVFANDFEVDVTDRAAVALAIRRARPDAVAHLAALSSPPQASAEPMRAFRVNYLGTQIVLETLRRGAPAARVLLVTSGAVYGALAAGEAPFTESAPLRPVGAYATSKAAAALLGANEAARGLNLVELRPFNHTGPGRPDHFVEANFARQIAEIEQGLRAARLQVGNLDARRDFLHVDDVVDAYSSLLHPAAQAGVFNVASGRATRIGDLLDGLLAHSRAQPEIVMDNKMILRPADSSAGDATRLARATGWSPRRKLDETLREVLDDWRARVAHPASMR